MRVIYSTARLENAERVAQLLEEAGVPVRLLFGPHHRRPSWRGANYRQAQDPGNWPRILVLNNGDLPRARTLLRELGLIAPAAFERSEDASATEDPIRFRARSAPVQANMRPMRLILVLAVLLVAAIQAIRWLS